MKEKWKSNEGPREKLIGMGAASLTDLELVAALLGTGTAKISVVEIARKILALAENNLGRLALLPLKELTEIHGVGSAKAVHLKAALEFARRAQYEAVTKEFKVITSRDAFNILCPNLGELNQEEFWVLFLNRRSNYIHKVRISRGGLSSTVADPRVIFRIALDSKATSIIVAHNHPSGNLTPSQADINLTKKLLEAGKLLDIQLVDHLIISGNNYCSFADSGLLT